MIEPGRPLIEIGKVFQIVVLRVLIERIRLFRKSKPTLPRLKRDPAFLSSKQVVERGSCENASRATPTYINIYSYASILGFFTTWPGAVGPPIDQSKPGHEAPVFEVGYRIFCGGLRQLSIKTKHRLVGHVGTKTLVQSWTR